MKIDVYSHSFMITKALPAEKKIIDDFCRGLVQFEMVMKDGVKSYRAAKVFASANPSRTYYRLHINSLKPFLDHLSYNQIREGEYELERHPAVFETRHRVKFDVLELQTPRDPQPAIIEHVCNEGTNKIVTLQTGKGKRISDDSLVRIPGGWKKNGKLKVGDLVISRDGTPTRVMGVYPSEGPVQLYRVTFADGRWVDADPEHLWHCFYVNTSPGVRWKVRDTMEMKRLIGMPNPRVYIPLPEPEITPEVSLPLDPWLLGVLIGDGGLSGSGVRVTTPDQFIVDEVNRLSPASVSLKHLSRYDYGLTKDIALKGPNVVVAMLRHLDLMGKVANSKFIPPIYLNGSIEQRWAMVQGLMDTDGTVQKSGSISYATASKQLALDLQLLVRSLGGIAAIHTRQPHYTHNGERKAGQLCYEVDIRHKTPSKFFRLARKKERTNDNGQYNADLKLRVMSIEPSRVAPATCIAVDHPEKLYVVQDYIVTHNTFLTKYCMNELGVRTVCFMKSSYIERWVPDMEKTFKFKAGEILIVQGSKSLSAIQEMALNGDLQKAKIIFISTNTYSTYVNEVEEFGVSEKYPVPPGEFFSTLNVGLAVLDEGHQYPHMIMKLFCYTHVPKFVTLSATLDTMDAFMTKIYELMYPRDERCNGDYYDVYIRACSIRYQLNRPRAVRYKGFGGAYNHTAYENSLMTAKNRVELKNYLDLIKWIVDDKFVKVMEKGQKMLVFCGTVKLCTLVQKYLQKMFPHLTVGRYVSGDKMSVFDGDIVVSTVLSAGTAVDIPNLRVSLMTTAIDSQQSNEQTLGRTRRLVGWPEVTPEFYHLTCSSIDKHMRYERNKMDFFNGKVLYYGVEQAPVMV